MYINTTPSLSSSHCACHRLLLLLVILRWHSPCALRHHGDGGGCPGSCHHPPPCHPHPPHPRPPCQAGWWWWRWGHPCCCAPCLTCPPCHRAPLLSSHCCHCHVDAGKGVVVGSPSLLSSSLSCPSSLPPHRHHHCPCPSSGGGGVWSRGDGGG